MIPRTRLCAYAAAAWCCGLLFGQSNQVQVRLTTPIGSYSPRGTLFRARVLGPVLPESPALPAGTLVEGVVVRAHKVGLGLRRERASIELEFRSCTPPNSPASPCDLELMAVDNARETVKPGNVISGILAASHLHSWFNGVWYRPAVGLTRRAIVGLTGAAGALQSRLIPSPLGAGLVLASKMALVRMPDPEIDLPAGTELIVRTRGGREVADGSSEAVPERIDPHLSQLTATVMRANGRPVQDLVNIALAGDEPVLENAFRAAGWFAADGMSARTFAKTYGAFASMKTYDTAPVSPLLYQDRTPDLVFQKSLNSISKRHHIRIWRHPPSGLWLAAATHDTGLVMSWTRMRPTHGIDQEIDRERTKVVNDLADAGCVEDIESIRRPHLANAEASKDAAVTDGRLYVIRLRGCGGQLLPPARPQAEPRLIVKTIRRTVLETRYYFTRGNVFYWAGRGVRSAFRKTLSRDRLQKARRLGLFRSLRDIHEILGCAG